MIFVMFYSRIIMPCLYKGLQIRLYYKLKIFIALTEQI